MNRTAGSKRKASAMQSAGTNSKSNATEQQESSQQEVEPIDSELQNEIEKVKDCSHPLIIEKVDALKKAKEKKIKEAERHRDMMVRNINEMFEYEQEDAESLFKAALVDVQERLVEEVTSEYNKLKQRRQEVESTESGTDVGIENEIIDAAANGSTERLSSRQRALRSAASGTAAQDTDNASESGGGRATRTSAESTQNGINLINGTLNKSSRSRKSSTNGSKEMSLDFTLPESSMRADFLEIVRDLQNRAVQYEKTKPQIQEVEVRLSGDLSELYIDKNIYGMGDKVVVFSTYSQENICGIITSLSHREIIIRTGPGARFAVLVGQIRAGRVTISKDEETIANAHVFRAAEEMDNILESYRRHLGTGNT